MSEPLELDDSETTLAIAVNGEVVLRLETKPESRISDVEAETAFYLLEQAVHDAREDGDLGKLRVDELKEHNPTIRIGDEEGWDEAGYLE